MAKTVFITGASGGIGQAACRAFAKAGYAVAGHYHTAAAEAMALRDELIAQGCDCEMFAADFGDETAAELADKASKRFGGVDVLVNNAGTAHFGLLTDMTTAQWRRLMAVNLDAIFHTCSRLLPQMIARKSGVIINVASVWGECGASCEAAYSAAKAGVIGLTKALAREVAPSGVRVNAISPGVIDTLMNAHIPALDMAALTEEIPMGRCGTAAEVADVMVFLAGSSASYITGQVVGINGGFHI